MAGSNGAGPFPFMHDDDEPPADGEEILDEGDAPAGVQGGPFVPPTCELLPDLTPERVADLRQRGTDPYVVRISIQRNQNGKRVTVASDVPAENATYSWLASTFGPGIYYVNGINRGGKYLTGKRTPIDGAPSGAASWLGGAPAVPSWMGGAPAATPYGPQAAAAHPMEALMLEVVRARLLGPQEDPMRSAMAEIAKMTAMGMEQQRQTMQLMMQQMTTNRAPSESIAKDVFGLLSTMMAKSNGNGSTLKETIELAQMLGSLGGGAAAIEKAEAPDEGWIKHVVPLVDALGPGIVATMAQAWLPADKAAAVLETMGQHMKARQAEAVADATIDTEGHDV